MITISIAPVIFTRHTYVSSCFSPVTIPSLLYHTMSIPSSSTHLTPLLAPSWTKKRASSNAGLTPCSLWSAGSAGEPSIVPYSNTFFSG